jgi:hypothetical protein
MFLAMPSWPHQACSSPVQRTLAGASRAGNGDSPPKTAGRPAVSCGAARLTSTLNHLAAGDVSFPGGMDDDPPLGPLGDAPPALCGAAVAGAARRKIAWAGPAGRAGLSVAPIWGHDANGRHRRTASLEA